MVRKILNLLLVMLLTFSLLPAYPSVSFAADGDSFVFDSVPTAVNSERLSLTGSLNNVSSSGITYTVERMSSTDFNTAAVLQKTEKSAIGVTVSTDGIRLTVTNLTLFPGINRITFFGKRGASEVQTVLTPITYIDSPILYNLAFTGNGKKQTIKETGITVVPNIVSSNPSQSLFSIEGNAPNAKEVIVDFGDNQSRSGTVRSDGTNYFIIGQIQLKKGKNTLKFHVKNDTQVIDVTRDVVYYNDAVTFYDVQLEQKAPAVVQDLRLLSDFLVTSNTSAGFKITGSVIVPNDFLGTASPMRIESAYRLAGQSGSNSSYRPDSSDTIVVRFSTSVSGAANMSTAELKDMLDFQTRGTSSLSLNPLIKDSTAVWANPTVNGATINQSQLNIKVGPMDEASGAFANLGRIVLKQSVVSNSDVNNKIDVLANDTQTVIGAEGITAVWDSGTVTASNIAASKFAVSFKGATVTLDASGSAGSAAVVGAPTGSPENAVTVTIASDSTVSEMVDALVTGSTYLDDAGEPLQGLTFSNSLGHLVITGGQTSVDNNQLITVNTIAGAGSLSFTNTKAQGTWNTGVITPGLTPAMANGTSNTVTFNGATVTINAGVAAPAAAINGTTGSVGLAPANSGSIIQGLKDTFDLIKAQAGSPIAGYNFAVIGSGAGSILQITGPQKNTSITVDGDGALAFMGDTSMTIGGRAPVKGVNSIKALNGVTAPTNVDIQVDQPAYGANLAISKLVSIAIPSTSTTPGLVAAAIQGSLSGDATIAGAYTVALSGDTVTLTQKPGNESAVNTTVTITVQNQGYSQIVKTAGSFDPRTPYVTEAYVAGGSAADNTRGLDPGEQLIVQLQDGTINKLSSSSLSAVKGNIDTMLDVMDSAGTALGKIGTNPSYTMTYSPTNKQMVINFNTISGTLPAFTLSRLLDGGVSGNTNKSDGYLSVSPSSGISNFFQTDANINQVRIGGSFDGDNGSPNPDPQNVPAGFAHAIFLDENLAEIGRTDISLTPVAALNDSDPYFTFTFTIDGSSVNLPTNAADFDKARYIQLEAQNTKKTRQAGGAIYFEGSESTDFGYILRDDNAPFINSLSFNDTVPESPTPSYFDLNSAPSNALKDGTTINKIPFAIKLDISDKGSNLVGTDSVTVKSTSASGASQNVTGIGPILSQPSANSRGVWFYITNLPFNGTQTLDITYANGSVTLTKSVRITVISGINVRFDGLTESQVIQYDPVEDVNQRADKIIGTTLKDFQGQFTNAGISASDYAGPTQKIFFTINNNEVRLKPAGADPSQFILDTSVDDRVEALDYFNQGQNTIKIKYVGTNLTYEKTFVINYFSINSPEIPKSPNGDIYPYGTDKVKPERDNRFTGSNGSYSTKQADMNISGSFDFIDLGTSYNAINAKRGSSSIQSNKYLLVIKGPDGSEWDWDLKTNTFSDTNGKQYSGSDPTSGLTITYDNSGQFFTFILKNQKLPTDGNKAVYNFYVYNDGLSGPSASFRLEVGTSGLPYKLLMPYLPQQSTINQNYVEVVLYAENADSAVVNKVDAEKVDFDGNYDGDTTDSNDYKGAFRAIVKDLKPNKSNKITFTIKRGSDSITDSFDVFYALANQPGAQYMETMKASHKLFEGKLTLTFAKDTYLHREDYNVAENLRTQLFKGHDLLFAIANSQDGVVDRYDYISPKPRGFSDLVEELGLRFSTSFDQHFGKASEVYWIDGGLADNPDTDEYDPYKTGLLPHQLSYSDLPSFDSVPSNRVLVPNKRGTIELAYNADIVTAAGNNLTVMHYDPENQIWENLGGQVNTSKKTIKVPFDKFGYYVVAKMNDSFQDVIRHPYARNQVEVMYSKGVIKPKSYKEFSPDSDITRAEFTAMVVRSLQLPLIEKPLEYSFDDVPTVVDQNSLWDYRYIETAARLGLIRGTNPRIFEPDGKISRQEAAVILARALQLKTETDPAKTSKDLQKLFKDWNLIDSYARPSIIAIAKKNFIKGSPVDENDLKKGYVFEPNANMLRGDAAILMSRVMTDQKKIPAVAEVK